MTEEKAQETAQEDDADFGEVLGKLAEGLGKFKDENTMLADIEFPIVISGLALPAFPCRAMTHTKVGTFVKVRPCAERFEDKTYLGIYIGEYPLETYAILHKSDSVLRIAALGNPLIYIPSLKETVYGAGSWWGEIESQEDLADITDEMIDSVWYVQLLKEMLEIGETVEGGNDVTRETDPAGSTE